MSEIVAAKLRGGHLVQLGASTNYALIARTYVQAGRVEVTIYNGDQRHDQPHLFFDPADLVHLSLCPDSPDGTWPRTIGR